MIYMPFWCSEVHHKEAQQQAVLKTFGKQPRVGSNVLQWNGKWATAWHKGINRV